MTDLDIMGAFTYNRLRNRQIDEETSKKYNPDKMLGASIVHEAMKKFGLI